MPGLGILDRRKHLDQDSLCTGPKFILTEMLRSSMAAVMRAVVVREFGGVKKMKVEADMPAPSVQDHEVLIKIHASGINPVDTYIREGMYASLPELPYVPGKDGAGVVEALGTKVTKFKIQFSSLSVINVCRAKAKKGERLLVHGASGGVGLAAVQMGRELGLHVVGTAGTDEGISLVKATGAHEVFNHRDPQYLKNLGAEKFDIILEMLANVNLDKDLTLMNPRGRTIASQAHHDIIHSKGAQGNLVVKNLFRVLKPFELIFLDNC
ncbi:Quinone oxidoreductase [Portunus trituberculatus]|uniref:Quinone oxidoreductase n=1 Tax=Portunus trituberculatus TaxID=210409 RepID=A0A5B7F930_PORTR|nr:Quinone oxidoreductase [Portunus trituberculatus]